MREVFDFWTGAWKQLRREEAELDAVMKYVAQCVPCKQANNGLCGDPYGCPGRDVLHGFAKAYEKWVARQ